MDVDKVEVSMISPSCAEWAKSHPWVPLFGLIFGALIAPGLVFGARAYWNSIRPEPTSMVNVIVHPRDEHGGIEMEVRFQTTNTKDCVWLGTHQLSRPPDGPDDGERRFVLLPASLAGGGYVVRAQSRYTIAFHLASTVRPATYTYAYRAFYQCGIGNLVPFQDEITREVVIP